MVFVITLPEASVQIPLGSIAKLADVSSNKLNKSKLVSDTQTKGTSGSKPGAKTDSVPA